MTDVLDQAQQWEEFERATAAAHVSRQARTLAAPSIEADCTDCAEEIEADRRAAVPGARRCLTCQEAFERGRRLCRA